MKKKIIIPLTAVCTFVLLALVGCTKSPNPTETANGTSNGTDVLSQSLSSQSVVSQDLSQLNRSAVVDSTANGLFAIGWKQFVGPNIQEADTVGEAFAVVRSDSSGLSEHFSGIDIGMVTLSYGAASIDLTKHTSRKGVLYATFSRGMRVFQPLMTPSIPFIPNGVYQFTVSGSSSFSAGVFTITAPPSLLNITSNRNGDTVNISNDLMLTWTGGSSVDSVLVRLVPHLRPEQIEHRHPEGMGMGPFHGGDDGGHQGMGGMMGGRHFGKSMDEGGMENDDADENMPFNLGPEFERGYFIKVTNTGTLVVNAADLQNLVSGTEAKELMISVTQLIKHTVQHDAKVVKLLLRNGDRRVLKIQ